ncbi:MAG TPA: magnesium transporter [Nitrospirae bacterium]|nr:magnesium transporter [Nitrospirota bacterium]
MAEAIALAAFIPVVMGMSGNVGTQSSALVIRGMATGKIAFSSLWAYIYREFKIGLALGFICGVIAGTGAQIWHGSYTLGLIVGISIFLSISLAALLGALIPFFFRWAKFDPAIAGGPIVLALNDISGLLIFFLVANLLLGLF